MLYGINNRFVLKADHERFDAVLKGKELKGVDEYNPLAAGDYVETDSQNRIVNRLPRKSAICRFNWKQNKPQTLCANLDLCLCVVAAANPPLHPRFLDRLLIACQAGGVKPLIVLNKADKGLGGLVETVSLYQSLGYEFLFASALEGLGIGELKKRAQGLACALIGSSGVGKSSLLNRLVPDAGQRTAEVNKKFDRGNHMTNYSLVFERPDGGCWIDTPGVRDFTPVVTQPLESYFSEVAALSRLCAYTGCRHDQEPDCAVKDAVAAGTIHQSRYTSYCKLLGELPAKESQKRRYNKR